MGAKKERHHLSKIAQRAWRRRPAHNNNNMLQIKLTRERKIGCHTRKKRVSIVVVVVFSGHEIDRCKKTACGGRTPALS
jgi:hypothetical protein